MNLPEKDWKYFATVRDDVLNELSRRINDKVRAVLDRTDLTENEKRLEIYGLVHEEDKHVVNCFDYWSRSRFLEHLVSMARLDLLTEEQMAGFTPETQELIAFYLKPYDDEEED